MIKKVFGIISYFPDNDSDYHIETRRERSRRFRELLFRLEELWPDIDIMIIAQNWQDFELPEIKNTYIIHSYEHKLGILGARKELRKKFLDSDYDYLIMLDDDGRILSAKPDVYMQEIDNHPDGIGVIRHHNCPLMLLAISKAIYAQVDMPDINAEKSEGFEDDIFVATCFAKFPDKAFDFPKNCIEEHSLKYSGPGKCPSTWAKEAKYDWDKMRNNTAKIIAELSADAGKSDNPSDISDIDVIITYVNSADRVWMNNYIKTTRLHKATSTRFRSWGTLRYLFRGIANYMPFVRNIILVVSGPTQVPVWINKETVRVVYHEDFIPKQLLPTFNSCTIESFFWNIPGLSDRLIYFNDDIFPIAPTKETDFFTGQIPHIQFILHDTYNKKAIYRAQCRTSMDMVSDALGLERYKSEGLVCPEHMTTTFIKSDMLKIGQLCEQQIIQAATHLRVSTNVNQYIYPYYHYFTQNYVDNSCTFKYFELWDKTVDSIVNELLHPNYQIVCLNDSDKVKDYARVRYKLDAGFEKKFPKPCKYEV